MSTLFPKNPDSGDQYAFGDRVWTFNGSAWDLPAIISSVENGLTLNSFTLGINPTAVVHVAGISADGGMFRLCVLVETANLVLRANQHLVLLELLHF